MIALLDNCILRISKCDLSRSITPPRKTVMNRPIRLTAMALLLLGVAACKSGGDEGGGDPGAGSGGGGGSVVTTPVAGLTILERDGVSAERILAAARNNPQARRAAAVALIALPEFSRNPALVHSNLANKIALGLTGAGVKVGIWDTGIDRGNINLGNVAFGAGTSTLGSVTGDDADAEGGVRHGTAVAQIIAGDVGDDPIARGIASGVEVHDIAALNESQDRGSTVFTSRTLESNLRYIVAQDLDLVNMSFSINFDPQVRTARTAMNSIMTPIMRDLLKEAADQGTVFVVATGNSGLAESDNMLLGLGQMDDMMDGRFIAVAALDENGTELASYSNACGSSMNYCITAVGTRIPVIDGNGDAVSFSGTSAATPVVTGSLALLREQFPELGSSEMVELVFATADDLGKTGIDAVYGRGALNMNKALQPVGDVVIATGKTTRDTMPLTDGIIEVDGALAGLAHTLNAITVSVMDGFDRGFEVSAGEFVSLRDDPVSPFLDLVIDIDAGEPWRFRADSEGGMLWSGDALTLGYAETEQVHAPEGRVLERGYAPDHALGQAAIVGYRNGRSDVRLAVAQDGAGLMGGVGQGWSLGNLALRADFGLMHESARFLGAEIASGSSTTAWAGLHARKEITNGFALFGDATLSHTQLRDGDFLLESADLRGASARVGVEFAAGAGRAVVTLGSPLVADGGTIISDIPVDRDASTDGNTSTGVERARIESRISAQRPVDLGIGWTGPIGERAELGVKFAHRFDDRTGMTESSWIGVGFRMHF
ncbi:S8 family peptidase [Paracoccus sp. ME4]|uniref:S8 family peptidase n=1 Tax=Paracoccus sp. ME4 TaxID=3138066 RepID=UPI00398B51B6